MFSLSGAINVCLFLFVRPQLLLFTHPEEPVEPEYELARPSTNFSMLPETVTCDHSLQPTGIGLGDDFGKLSRNRVSEDFRSSTTLPRVSSNAKSLYNDI
jgi:hypothetical protein